MEERAKSNKPGEDKEKRIKAKGIPESKETPPTPHQAPAESLPTADSQLQTENMEVHHHPEVEKKGFKEYILEGMMIFLAVLMGFIAENIRENISNSEHVKQLSVQLVQDIKSDTAALHQIDSAESRILKRTDSLSVLLQQPLAKADTKNIQRLVVHCYSSWPFHPSLGAITSIKNELHLKQFSESKISIYISDYEGRTAILKKIEDLHELMLRDYIEPFLRFHFTARNLNSTMDKGPVIDGEMRDLTQKDLTQLSVDLALIRNINDGQVNYNRRLKQQAIELISYAKKQYNLGDE